MLITDSFKYGLFCIKRFRAIHINQKAGKCWIQEPIYTKDHGTNLKANDLYESFSL